MNNNNSEGINIIRKIYLNLISESISKGGNNFINISNNIQNSYSHLIAQEYILNFLNKNNMNNSIQSLLKETKEIIHQKHDQLWLSRKLKISSTKPMFKQLKYSLGIRNHKKKEIENITETSEFQTASQTIDQYNNIYVENHRKNTSYKNIPNELESIGPLTNLMIQIKKNIDDRNEILNKKLYKNNIKIKNNINKILEEEEEEIEEEM